MADSLPWWIAIPTGLYFAAYPLLENKQQRGRHYLSLLKKHLGVDHA